VYLPWNSRQIDWLMVHPQDVRLTGGISFGRSTSFVTTFSPLRGHSSSMLFICSQRSVFWLIKRIRPYLTCRLTYASCKISCVKFPLALMLSVSPLRDVLALKLTETVVAEGRLTLWEDLGIDQHSRSSECNRRYLGRRPVGCRQAPWACPRGHVGCRRRGRRK
jgi:hypothetical protein